MRRAIPRLVALLVLVVLAIELAGFAAFRLATGRWFSWTDQSARRAEILDESGPERFTAANVAVPWNVRLHPYHGSASRKDSGSPSPAAIAATATPTSSSSA